MTFSRFFLRLLSLTLFVLSFAVTDCVSGAVPGPWNALAAALAGSVTVLLGVAVGCLGSGVEAVYGLFRRFQ